jgi:hypothetical protein
MKIKVLKTTKAATCELGISTTTYKAGETYDIYDELAKVFIKEGWGENPDNTKKIEKPKIDDVKIKAKNKVKTKATLEAKIENKAIEEAPENKNKGK